MVLPALAPPPTAFGRVQVSFAGAKAPWEQAQRPSFPMGQSLAEEVTDAAEGLRDVESMDEELEPEPAAPAAVDEELNALGEGAPSDEWDIAAAALDPDQDEAPGSEIATAPDETETPDELNVHASAHTIAELQPQAEPIRGLKRSMKMNC